MRKVAIIVLVLALLGALLWGWQARRGQEQAELQLGLDSSRVLEQQFRAARQIKVAAIDGRIVARSSDDGFFGILKSTQTKSVPFTVDYLVDLSDADASDWRWDEDSRTLIVAIPDVQVGSPNVDESRAVTQQSGIYISREAGLNLNQRAASAVRARAQKFARSPENLQKARAGAKEAVAALARLPLEAAGKSNIKIVVKFPFEGGENLDRWDESRPIADVIREIESQ
ncbi:DUF4230 domain-containing protein [Sphingorhabdus arenilitoris]|uniref:DUF4230 domain-containing protein n=1 Tax=Sphingorhabdus arenilitoris TaxID=1490041 RepID=A0ABV8RHY7_9SPHN